MIMIMIMIMIFNIYIAHFSYGYDQMRITNKYSFQQLRVLDSLQQLLTYINNCKCPQYYYPTLFDKCVGSFKSLDRVLRNSNRLQMLEQRQHFLLNYFKTLSVGPAGNRTRASHTIDLHLTN